MRYQPINHKISHGKCEVIDWGAGKQHSFKSCDMACTVDTHKKSTTVKKKQQQHENEYNIKQ